MKDNKKSSDELNYKEAYYYLFNQVTDMITKLKGMQKKAESICIDEPPPVDVEINIGETLGKMADYVNKNRGD